MKSSASQPLGLGIFKGRGAGDPSRGAPERAFANQLFSCARLLCSLKTLPFGRSGPGPDFYSFKQCLDEGRQQMKTCLRLRLPCREEQSERSRHPG